MTPNGTARVALLLAVLGAVGMAGSWVQQQFTERAGVVGGSDVFVVHANRQHAIRSLASGLVEEGQDLAEFMPTNVESQLEALSSRLKQAQARVEGAQLRVLPVDALLLQKQAHVRSQMEQTRSFQYDLQKSVREIEKALLDAATQAARDESQIDGRVATEGQALKTAIAQVQVARGASERANTLRSSGVGTVQATEVAGSTLLNEQLNRDTAQAALDSLQKQRSALAARFANTQASLLAQRKLVEQNLASVTSALATLVNELHGVEDSIGKDRGRAVAAADRELTAVRAEIEALHAEKSGLLATTRVRAPFAGEVVYRHPAPGLAADNAPILAFSKSTGFLARVSLPAKELAELRKAGLVRFSLPQPLLNRVFTGEFRGVEEVSHEPSRAIAHFDVRLPADAITLLASSGNTLPVTLRWAPTIAAGLPFQASAAALGLGILLLVLGSVARGAEAARDVNRPRAGVLPTTTVEVERHPASAHPDTWADPSPEANDDAPSSPVLDPTVDRTLRMLSRTNRRQELEEALEQIRRGERVTALTRTGAA